MNELEQSCSSPRPEKVTESFPAPNLTVGLLGNVKSDPEMVAKFVAYESVVDVFAETEEGDHREGHLLEIVRLALFFVVGVILGDFSNLFF